ncbi:BF3164 family lipoprotein [Mongoliitalea lutea]|uniref:TolB-like 6-blade propeller-like n=1 Tax=Mongoliitalea lutea TaxID=849756 RepID=A0A8J3D0Q9_9BACT|nr:BF3164 family lipoprotein [Mongoliitalea lutea]GHB52359.1 hypothetical protein GCM10008106_36300 [Mongoliitalea lutea]
MRFVMLFLLFLISSCSTKVETIQSDYYEIKTFTENDIPEAISLKGKKFDFPQLINPRHIFWEGDYLIVAERGNDTLMHVIDIKENKYIKRIGQNGLGPGEITMIHRFQKDKEKGNFWVYDAEQKIFAKYNLYSNSALSEIQFKQSEELFLAMDMVWSSDSTWMTIRADKEEKFVEFNIKGEIIQTFGSWEGMLDVKDVPYSVISSIHQGVLAADPARKHFVKVGVARDYIEILEKETGKIISVRGPEQFVPEFEVHYSGGYPYPHFHKNSPNFYTSCQPKSKYIYTLYFGKDMELYKEGLMDNRVLVFDYKGNIIMEFDLDHYLLSFTIDEENRKIYGITYDAEPNIVEFQF